jgi:apolipoprotein N-acyltransferase
LVATYDKFHLVPFGEYMPFNKIIPLKKLTIGGTDFSAGPGPRTLELPGLPPFSPLVCYEVIFPGEVVDPKHRPAWLLNVTNDGWYGISFGPYQHLASSRMRAIEEGLPLVRANNTGISVVTDAYGRIVASLGLGQTGHLDSHLPVGLFEPTPFAKLGNLCILAVALLMTLSGLLGKVIAGQSVRR